MKKITIKKKLTDIYIYIYIYILLPEKYDIG